jgi:hypothetical protein
MPLHANSWSRVMVLDLLIANAGIMATLLTRDVRGYEGQL